MQLHEKYQKQGFTVVAVSQQKPEIVKEFVQKQQPPFPFALDPDGSVAARYEANGTPNNYLLNPEGQVVAHVEGLKPEAFESRIVEAIPRLLKDGDSRRVSALR